MSIPCERRCARAFRVRLDPVAFGRGDRELGVRPHKSLHRVQHLGDVRGVGGNDGEAEFGALPFVVMTGLGGRHREAPPRRVEKVAYDGAFVFQRAAGFDDELDGQDTCLHADSLTAAELLRQPPFSRAWPLVSLRRGNSSSR